MRFQKISKLILPFIFLGLQFGLSLHASWNLSPTWDEINYPFSGYTHLKTGSLDFYPDNPYLSRLVSGVMLCAVPQKAEPSFEVLSTLGPAQAGFLFFHQKAVTPRTAIFLSRFLFHVVFIFFAGVLYLLAKKVWGPSGGLIVLFSTTCIPIFLSRSSLALLEMPLYLFAGLALWSNARWFERKKDIDLVRTGLFTGLALLCKYVALPLVATICLTFLFSKESWGRRIRAIFIYGGMTLTMILLFYLPWGGGWAAFQKTIDAIFIFNKLMPYYWKGHYLDNASSLLSYGAFLVKFPPVFLALLLASVWEIRRRALYQPAVFQAILLMWITLAQPLFLSQPVTTVQLSPFFIGAVFLTGALGFYFEKSGGRLRWVILGALLINFADVVRAHPHYAGYFNSFAGGPRRGYRWLTDSDQDWGQSLPAAESFVKSRPDAQIFLSYSGAGDPSAYGISYFDFISPALVGRYHRDPEFPPVEEEKPAYALIATKVWQTYGEAFIWIEENRKPIDILDGSFLVFDITNDAAAFRWMAGAYKELERPVQSEWCLKKAEWIEKSRADKASNK